MTFTYTPASPTDRDRLRLFISDTNAAQYVFEDEELQLFLDAWPGDLHLAAAQALRAIAISQAKFAIYYQVNGFSLDRRGVAKNLTDLADKLEARVLATPWELESVLDHVVDEAGVDRSVYQDTEP